MAFCKYNFNAKFLKSYNNFNYLTPLNFKTINRIYIYNCLFNNIYI